MPRNLPDFKGLKLDFDLIDSHHHLFDLDTVYYPWLSDRPESDFLLGDLEVPALTREEKIVNHGIHEHPELFVFENRNVSFVFYESCAL